MNIPPQDPDPNYQNPPPPVGQYPRQQPAGSDNTMGGLIPADNPPSLLAYYLGIVSCLPLIGLPFGIYAFIQAQKAFKNIKAHPGTHGKTHAIVGMVCCIVCFVLHAFFLFIAVAISLSPKHS